MLKVKNWKLFVLVGILALSACGAPEEPVSPLPENAGEVDSGSGEAGPVGADSGPGLDLEGPDLAAKLALLTFHLEGTDQQVTQEQAGSLLPLWKAVRAISESDTAAVEELAAVYRQIAGEMTEEQIAQMGNAYSEQADVQALMLELGVEPANPNGTGDGTRTGGPGTGMGGGPGGGGGAGAGVGMELTPEQQATLQAERQALAGRGIGQVQNLLQPIIDLLEERAAG